MKLVLKLTAAILFMIAIAMVSCNKEPDILSSGSYILPPPPPPTNELILKDLTWNLFHSSADISGAFDEIYLAIGDTLGILSHHLSVFVKLDSSNSWVYVNELIGGNWMSPYTYFRNTSALYINPVPINYSLVGTKADVKIVY